MEIEHAVAIPGIANIIGEYLVEKEDDKMEVQGMLQKQEEDVEMGVGDEVARKQEIEVEDGTEWQVGDEEEWGEDLTFQEVD